MSVEKLMEDHIRKMKIQIAKELFSPMPAMRALITLAMVWTPLLLLRDPAFAEARPSWVDSAGFFYALLGISCISVLIESTKSLLPAVLLWVAAIIVWAIGAHSEIVYGLFLAAFTSSFVFKFTH